MALDLPNDDNPPYRKNISGCTSATIGLATENEACPEINTQGGCLDVLTGGRDGQDAAVADIIATDPLAVWSGGRISGGDGLNERVVPVALFDPALYSSHPDYNGTNGIVKLVGILGFFVEGFCSDDSFEKETYLDCSNNGNDVVGRLVSFPGISVAGAGENTGGAAFGQVIRLIR